MCSSGHGTWTLKRSHGTDEHGLDHRAPGVSMYSRTVEPMCVNRKTAWQRVGRGSVSSVLASRKNTRRREGSTRTGDVPHAVQTHTGPEEPRRAGRPLNDEGGDGDNDENDSRSVCVRDAPQAVLVDALASAKPKSESHSVKVVTGMTPSV